MILSGLMCRTKGIAPTMTKRTPTLPVINFTKEILHIVTTLLFIDLAINNGMEVESD